jgi:hypothetical protein
MKQPFGEYAPDAPPDISIVVGGKNVFVRPAGSYGPMTSFAASITAITSRAQGAFYSIDTSANTAVWCGDATKLYRLAGASTSFSDVSKVGGYTTGTNEFWNFMQFGNRVIATNFTQSIQQYQFGVSSLFSDLSATAPKARIIQPVANFVFTANTSDGTFGAQPNRCWWSAINDPTNWPTPATSAAAAVQSGFTDLSGNGGFIQAVAPRVGALDAIIIQERQLVRCQYVGSPEVFSFQPLENAQGTPAPQSVAVHGGIAYYLGDDGFYACDGSQSLPIGAGKVDKFFYQDLNQAFTYRVQGVYDPINRLYIVGYPSTGSGSGNIDRLLIYSTVAQKWAPPTEVSLEFLCRLGSVGYTLEQLDGFGTMETLPASLDSRLWVGSGKPLLAAFDTLHRQGGFTGTALECSLETGDLDSGNGSRFITQGVRPDINGISAGITCSIGYRESKNATVSYTTPTALQRNLVAPARITARHPRVKVNIAAGANWTHATGFDLLANIMGDK